MVFTQLQNALCHTSAEGPEITGIGAEGHIGQMVDDGITPEKWGKQDMSIINKRIGKDIKMCKLYINIEKE